jgi:hypothetical protein
MLPLRCPGFGIDELRQLSGPGLQRIGALAHPLDENLDARALPLEFQQKPTRELKNTATAIQFRGNAYAGSTILKQRRDA